MPAPAGHCSSHTSRPFRTDRSPQESIMSGLEGKVVAITGASSGIGEATARLLAARGAQVLIGARRGDLLEKMAGEIATAGGTVRQRVVDVTDASDVEDFIGYAEVEFGRVDVIVNNAGLMPLSRLDAGKI